MCYNPALVRNKPAGAPASVKLVYYIPVYVEVITRLYPHLSMGLTNPYVKEAKDMIRPKNGFSKQALVPGNSI